MRKYADVHSGLFMLPCKSNISYRLIQPPAYRLIADAHSNLFILSCKSNISYRLIQPLARLVSGYYCY